MIVGNGLIATTLWSLRNENYTIFASGVSNSNEHTPAAYLREKELLLSQDRSKKLIYFSTCSINDPELSQTHYIRHKLAIEKLIQEEFPEYLILRLPTLVGKTNNPNTFFNHMKNKIINNEQVIVYKNAWRYLLDADDLKIMVPVLLTIPEVNNTIIHAAYYNAMPVIDIVEEMDRLLIKTSRIKLIDKGSHFPIESNILQNLLTLKNISLFNKNYNEKLIKKYLLH